VAYLIFDAGSSAKLTEVEGEIAEGDLWGVSLGTTTKSSSHSTWLLISATPPRCRSLFDAAPEWVRTIEALDGVAAFSDGSLEEKTWLLRGRI
jgi:hypothetical protein